MPGGVDAAAVSAEVRSIRGDAAPVPCAVSLLLAEPRDGDAEEELPLVLLVALVVEALLLPVALLLVLLVCLWLIRSAGVWKLQPTRST